MGRTRPVMPLTCEEDAATEPRKCGLRWGGRSPKDDYRRERTPTKPHPSAPGARSLMRVKNINSAGFRPGCLPYAHLGWHMTADIRRPSPGRQSQCEGLTKRKQYLPHGCSEH